MTTYQEYLNLLRQLPPNLQEIVRQLWESGRTLNARELLRLLGFLFASGNADLIRRILILLARLGRFTPGTVQAALELHAAGEGASVVGGAAAGEGGAAAAAGAGLAATIAAILAALLAILLAAYTITTEVRTEISYPGTGLRCQASGDGNPTEYHLFRRGIGSRTALQRAIDAAQAHCEEIGSCEGECEHGTCKPVASFIRLDPRYRVFWTTAHVWYICVCQCVVE